MLDLTRVREQLPDWRVLWFESLDSTMFEAARLIRAENIFETNFAGVIIGAEQQTGGIGRHGHSWYSEAGTGLYVSIVLNNVYPSSMNPRPINADQLPLLMLALGLATHQAITQVSGLQPDLRWPNDVLLPDSKRDSKDAKKCAGVLAQVESGAIIAGIGINVSQQSFPPDIAPIATSLFLAGAPQVSREDLLVALVRAVDQQYKSLIKEGPDAIRGQFARASSYVNGKRVSVELESYCIEGVTRGLDPYGFLIVRDDNGKDTTILAGGVRPI